MSIDFFTFIAQIINLIILLFLLRKFLYIPVLKAVSERQSFIEQELKKAADAHKKAQYMEQMCRQKMVDIETERQQILLQTGNEAEETARQFSEKAKKEFETARKQWQDKLKAEQRAFALSLQNITAKNFRLFANNSLKQFAGTDLNELVIKKFKEKIISLPAKKKREIIAAYQSKKIVNIFSAQKLPKEMQRNLEIFLREQLNLDSGSKLKFTVRRQLVCGISLQADEQVVSWNLENYLTDFNKNVNAQILQLTHGE